MDGTLKDALKELGDKARRVATGKEEPEPVPNRRQRRQAQHARRKAKAAKARRKHEGRRTGQVAYRPAGHR